MGWWWYTVASKSGEATPGLREGRHRGLDHASESARASRARRAPTPCRPRSPRRAGAASSSAAAAVGQLVAARWPGGDVDRAARVHRAPAGEGADAERDGRGVAADHRDPVERDAERVRRDLGERRLVPLALAARRRWRPRRAPDGSIRTRRALVRADRRCPRRSPRCRCRGRCASPRRRACSRRSAS